MEEQQPASGLGKKVIDEATRRRLINNYFKVGHVEFPSWTSGRILLVYIGIFMGIVLIFYLKSAIPTIIFSTMCFVFAFWNFYQFLMPYFKAKKLYSERPLEEQMLYWLIKDLKETVKPKAIENLCLNISDIKPENFIIIPVPIFWEVPGIPSNLILRRGNSDTTYLYSIWRVQILALTKHYISLYKCNYNWLDNSINNETTNEFYFQDITSIRNDIQNIDFKFIDNPEKTVGTGRVFHVANKSGENMIVLNDIPSLQLPKNVAVNLEYVVSLLRMILRNRRFGIEREVAEPQEDKKTTTKEGQQQDPIQHNIEIKQKNLQQAMMPPKN